MSYEVGQILYTVLEDKKIIIPVQVIEQIVIKDLNGEETNYKVLLPNKKFQKVNIKKLENIFLDIDEVNEYILKKAKSSIDKMLEDAMMLEDEYFNRNKKEKDIDDSFECKKELKNDIIKNNQIKINLENGQTANIIDNTNLLDEDIINKEKEKEKDNNESTTS